PRLTPVDGGPAKADEERAKARHQTLKARHDAMGAWPPLIDKPKVESLEKVRRECDGLTQHHLRIEVAPDRNTDDAYLLVPDGQGPYPAVLVVFYDAKTGVGLGQTERLDFGLQLARRGFVVLSLGGPPASYYP